MTRMPSGRHRGSRALAALGLCLAWVVMSVVSVGIAHAAPDPGVTLGSLRVVGSQITGTLTVRGVPMTDAERGAVTATVDGSPQSVTLDQAPVAQRRAMLVIDTSGSMGTSGMATVRAATKRYLDIVPADVAVGVVSFASTAGVELEPTLDRGAVQRVADSLTSRGDTSLYAGLDLAARSLASAGDATIVLLSDGADTASPDKARAQAATISGLSGHGIRMTVVQFRSTDPAATSALTALAATPGGVVVTADDSAQVSAAFAAAAHELETQSAVAIPLASALTAGPHQVALAGTVNGKPFTTQAGVEGAAVVVVTPSPSPSSGVGAAGSPGASGAGAAGGGSTRLTASGLSPLAWAAAVLAALALSVLAYVVLTPTLQTRRESRVEAIRQLVADPAYASGANSSALAPISEGLSAWGDRALAGRAQTPRLMRRLERAGWALRPGEWLVLVILAGLVGGMLGYLFLAANPLFGLFAGVVVGLLIPQAVLSFAADRRAAQFDQQLPDLLSLVATSLSSGFALQQALDGIVRESTEPTRSEFSRALAETRIGIDIADALERLGQRMGSTSLEWAVMAIRIQREVGGTLADTLRTTSATLREREVLQRQVRTLSAEGRLSAGILIALPVIMLAYQLLVNYAYVRLLWTTPLGLAMSVMTLVMMAIGIVWMRSIVRIEV